MRRRAMRWVWRILLAFLAVVFLAVLVFRFIDPPLTYLTLMEERRLGSISQDWVEFEDLASVMPRSVVAAEDANFCLHWGFDMGAIREAVASGAERGASTITQQVVKNVYLWPARRWDRKALEAIVTPIVELVWPKRRILEVYLNVAEFGEGVFGVEAAAKQYFGVKASALSAEQAALLSAVLPNPKARSVKNPTTFMANRARSIIDGAATIQADGRAFCFED
ncbi:MAG: monofunctional biosynthetic peptidoglycan transglycosylase [Paracoccaceae bacterium]|nr:monofunctional biosynthetic peptidoglycan transglycosylase [Paracoccaceae bacterium]